MAVSRRQRSLTGRQHEVGTVDARHVAASGRARPPDERHAVGRDETGVVVDVAEPVVAPALHHAVHAGDADVAARIFRDPAVEDVERLVHADGAHLHAEHVHALDLERVALTPQHR